MRTKNRNSFGAEIRKSFESQAERDGKSCVSEDSAVQDPFLIQREKLSLSFAYYVHCHMDRRRRRRRCRVCMQKSCQAHFARAQNNRMYYYYLNIVPNGRQFVFVGKVNFSLVRRHFDLICCCFTLFGARFFGCCCFPLLFCFCLAARSCLRSRNSHQFG